MIPCMKEKSKYQLEKFGNLGRIEDNIQMCKQHKIQVLYQYFSSDKQPL